MENNNSKINTPNVVFDFTRPDLGQVDVAIMPAGLAKKLLKLAAATSSSTITSDLMETQVNHLRVLTYMGQYDEFVKANLDFVLERQLMNNIENEKWDAYTIKADK